MQQQKPPPPPRSRKAAKRPPPQLMRGAEDGPYSDDDHSYATYPLRKNERNNNVHQEIECSEAPVSPSTILDREPETVIGETLEIRGKLKFERLLRLDGIFEGELESQGDLIVGPSGEIRGDLDNMKDVVIFGKVIGNIAVDSLDLCGSASVYGSITCRTCRIDPTVVLVGTLNINPYAPQIMNNDGTLVPLDDLENENNSRPAQVENAEAAEMQQQPPPQTPQAPAEPSAETEIAAASPSAAPEENATAEPSGTAFADGVGEIPIQEPGGDDANDASGTKEEATSDQQPPADDSAGTAAAAAAEEAT